MRIDQTQGGWIPPQEPSASWRSAPSARPSRSAASRERAPAAPAARVLPGRAPISRRSMSAWRTGRSARTTESGTTVCRAQQAKL